MMTDYRSEPFGKLLTEAEAEIITRNRHLGWDAATIEDARQARDRSFRVGLEPLDPPRSRGQVVAIVVLGAAFTTIGGALALVAYAAGLL